MKLNKLSLLDSLLIFFLKKAYYQESYILIIEYSSVITVAEWLDGSFESQSRLEKAIQKQLTTASNNKSDRPQVNIWDN
jgi:hypothetical protein